MKQKDVVCLDTSILIWGVREFAEPGQESLIERAQHFLKRCDEEGKKVIVPSIVLGELLAGVPHDKMPGLIDIMGKRFMVLPFDTPAAIVFARMWRDWKGKYVEETESDEYSRKLAKADHMILATAITKGAWCIYTHDKYMKRFADGSIEVFELPEMPPRQTKLFPT